MNASHALAGAALLAVLSGAARPAEDPRVQVERGEGGIEVRAEAEIEASATLVWETLTDYERLPSFIPGIARSRVVERRGRQLVLEQSGESRFLIFSFPISVRLEVTESPPSGIASRALEGNLKRMIGRYEIVPGTAPDRLVLRYAGILEPGFDLPPFIGMAALRSMVREQFAAMVSEIRRRSAQQQGK